jgi:pyrroline-5-carboxylate reductase
MAAADLPPIGRRLGFIGIGTINNAVIRGLLRSDVTLSVTLGPRSATKVAALRKDFPERTNVALDNAGVVERSDWIFVATPPPPKGDPKSVLEPLTFKGNQIVVSLIACVNRATLEKLVAPARVVQTFPLPPAEHGASAVICSPDVPEVTAALNRLGCAVAVNDHSTMTTLVPMTCVMGHFYATQRAYHQWLVSKGVAADKATVLVAQMFRTFNHASLMSNSGFDALVAEQTPGGVNESVIAALEGQGHYDALKKELDRVLSVFQ